nr:transketolase [Anaerolineae bacterium]
MVDIPADLDDSCINTIRFLAVDAVQKANSGHPGLPMGAAAVAYTLWTRFLKHNPHNPSWPDRDRFILSAGHGSMLLYALLHLSGYELSLEEIKQFRQWGSRTPGHPESHLTPGVEVTTGPLGQGFANGVGMAVAERFLSERFNTPEHRIVDHFTYAIVSDGDLMEGVSAEAASYAGMQKLGKLICLYDDNEISIEGNTDFTFTEDVSTRFRAYGWHVVGPIDGNSVPQITGAIREAQETDQPSLIICSTTIGYGSPNNAGTAEVHGSPLGEDEVVLTKKNLDWPLEPSFHIPDEALMFFRKALVNGQESEAIWREQFEDYRTAHPDRAAEFERMMSGNLPENWDKDLPEYYPSDKAVATRVTGGQVLNSLFENLPDLVGGSADLEPSTKTWLKKSGRFGHDRGGHNLQFGVREHAMGAIALGMAHHGGVIPYTATFLVFSDYMRPPIRLAALSQQRVVFIFTHDSIGVGEDGPTHQPVEQLAALRAIPGVHVIRPADANEVVAAWRQALLYRDGPTILALTRQGVPVLDSTRQPPDEGVARGAYILLDSDNPQIVLIGAGSEVHLVLRAADVLVGEGIPVRVVSIPCWELFDAQPQLYRDAVLPPDVPGLAVEAGVTMGWHKYVGKDGAVIGLDRFGSSAPGPIVMSKLGFNVENVLSEVRSLLAGRGTA